MPIAHTLTKKMGKSSVEIGRDVDFYKRRGLSDFAIANILGCTPTAVKYHRQNYLRAEAEKLVAGA